MNICKMKRSTQIAIMTGAGSGAVEKTATGTSPLTLSDSVAGTILGITVKGHSEVVDGTIKSIGDATGATPTLGITSEDGAGQGTAATITTGLPLRSVSDSIYDTLDNEKVIKKCAGGKVNDTNIWVWSKNAQVSNENRTAFETLCPNGYYPLTTTEAIPLISTAFDSVSNDTEWVPGDISYGATHSHYIIIVDPTIKTVEAFLTAYGNEEIYYPLATPTETLLTSAETTALSALETYDPTTVISITDNPSITVKYMGKRATRAAPKKRTNRKKKS